VLRSLEQPFTPGIQCSLCATRSSLAASFRPTTRSSCRCSCTTRCVADCAGHTGALLTALHLQLLKPADADSDEEAPLALIDDTRSAAQKQRDRAEAEDAEIEMVRKRIAAARMNAPDGELDLLQDRQRARIERHNSYVSSVRSGAEGGGAMRDLIDLDFDNAG